MKHFWLILFCICFSTAISAQSKKALRTFGITHKVETVVEYNKEGVEKARYIKEKETYDSDGEWVRKLKYSSDGELKNEEIRAFDNGEIIDYTEIDYNGSKARDPYFVRYTYTYHRGKPMSETRWTREGGIIEKRAFTYNRYGDPIEQITTDETGNLKKREVLEYDRRGLIILKTTFDADGTLKEKAISDYE